MTGDFEEIEPCESVLVGGDELVYRQITEYHWDAQNSKPATHAFGPSPIDKGMASYARSSIVTPKQSLDWHNEHVNSQSLAVWAVSVQEIIDQELRSVDDSDCPGDRSPGHCYVDYRHLSTSKQDERRARGMLLARALARGEIPTV